MLKVKDIFGLSKIYPEDRMFGVEVEVEGTNLPAEVSGWLRVEDHSLRGECAEYVFSAPQSFSTSVKMVDSLYNKFKERSKLNNSVRCAIHVHVNVQEYTIPELYTFLCAYYLFEDVMTHFCGSSRTGNMFCLRVNDADYQLFLVRDLLKHNTYHNLSRKNCRYSALNIQSLCKFGSLEFRALETPKEPTKVITWLIILSKLRDFSKSFKDPSQLTRKCKDIIHKEGYDSLLKRVFGDHLENKYGCEPGIINAMFLSEYCDWSIYFEKEGNIKTIFPNNSLKISTKELPQNKILIKSYEPPERMWTDKLSSAVFQLNTNTVQSILYNTYAISRATTTTKVRKRS